MRGRRFLELAREVLIGGTEPHWRATVGRAYYALMLECRDALFRWGFKLPPRDNVHTWVRMRFSFPSNGDLKIIGLALDRIGRLRNSADYDLSALPAFLNDSRAKDAIRDVTQGIALLDAMNSASDRRNDAISAILKAFP